MLMYSLKCGCGREAGFEQNKFAFDVTGFCVELNSKMRVKRIVLFISIYFVSISLMFRYGILWIIQILNLIYYFRLKCSVFCTNHNTIAAEISFF